MLDQLRAKGLASKDLQSAALSLQPKFEVKRDRMGEVRGDLIGYVALKSVVAIIEDVAVVPSYIREFPLAGSLRIADIGYFSTQVEAAHRRRWSTQSSARKKPPKRLLRLRDASLGRCPQSG